MVRERERTVVGSDGRSKLGPRGPDALCDGEEGEREGPSL